MNTSKGSVAWPSELVAVSDGRYAQRGLQDGAFVVPYEEADRGGLAARVADPEVRGVHRGHAAVGAADAVAALPAGELEGLGDAGAGAGGVRPGREVGEGLADDLLGGVAEEFLRVLVPGGDGAGAVDLDDRDADAAVGEREEVGGQGRAGGAGAHRAVGEVELEPDLLVRGRVLDAPAAGQGRAQLEAAAALAVGAAHVDGRRPGVGSHAPGSGRPPRCVRRRRCADTGRRRRCPRVRRRW